MDFELSGEQRALGARARALADGVFRDRAARWDEDEAYPWDNVKDLVRAGFMGITIPRSHGGPGGSVLGVLLVVEEIARVCGVTARIVVEGSLGVVGALTAYGTEAQKRRYFPWVLEGAGPSRLSLVYCRLGHAPGAAGIGGVLVERDTAGFRIGERDRTMGLRGIPEGRLHFDRCRVPRESVLVGPPDGFKKLMRAYNSQRLGAAPPALGTP